MTKRLKTLLEIFGLLAVFVIVSYFIQINLNFFTDLISGHETLGAVIYIFLGILVTVFAPLTAIPIIPLVSVLYGWPLAGLLSFIGWFIGSLIIFYISRKWGKPIVRKFISLEKIQKFESSIPKKRKVFSLILLRIALPADVLSYALGLFTNISWKVYIFVTFIGMLPFAFILAYFGGLSFVYQVIGLFIIGIIFFIAVLIEYLKKKSKKQ
ncbi:MAG: TVP38/TMEM64 family protein [Nanoarchaeota archaeon]